MRLAVFTVICILSITVGSFSQTQKTPAKTPLPAIVPAITEISQKDWDGILKTLETENWDVAVSLISQSFTKLKIENDKKQLARLRYFYLYSLAGKVSKAKLSYAELEKTTDAFLGKDFLMPPRKVLADCKSAVNYICQLKNYSQTLRFTASNKAFDSIHSFEYVQIPDIFEVSRFNGLEVVLGGKLKKVEFNPKKDTTWIMRLYFESGTVQAAF